MTMKPNVDVIFTCVSFLVYGICSAYANTQESSYPSSVNCTWTYLEQPLSHFERGLSAGYYKQRLCVYDKFWQPNKSLPVLFYTGNESPVDEYVNNTGLIWDLAPKLNALIVFAEHRYFGESIPKIQGKENCISYLSSAEALADYAALCNRMRREWGAENSAIIAFGGSYGGMLSSWLRILYPSAIDGAIAASAPTWGFPLNKGCPLDGSATVVSYAASSAAGAAPMCASNLKAAYVLINEIASTEWGREALSEAMNLCVPLESTSDIKPLLSYLQSPLFNLAEGSYPFPSSYITFALTGSADAPLPPWAMTVMCDSLAEDYNIVFEGDTNAVQFSVSIGGDNTKGGIKVGVDWDTTTASSEYSLEDLQASRALDLASAVASSIQVWYNVTGTLPSCIDWTNAAPNSERTTTTTSSSSSSAVTYGGLLHSSSRVVQVPLTTEGDKGEDTSTSSSSCSADDSVMDTNNAWNILTCNEGINLVNWWVQGVGNDLYWPPNQPKGYNKEDMVRASMDYCAYLREIGLVGIPDKRDSWGLWVDTVYGGERMHYVSNIVYSNGNLDPWSPAGVPGSESSPERDVISLVIDRGGHHLDLFFPTADDPESVKEVRAVEEKYIRKWIAEKAKK